MLIVVVVLFFCLMYTLAAKSNSSKQINDSDSEMTFVAPAVTFKVSHPPCSWAFAAVLVATLQEPKKDKKEEEVFLMYTVSRRLRWRGARRVLTPSPASDPTGTRERRCSVALPSGTGRGRHWSSQLHWASQWSLQNLYSETKKDILYRTIHQ